MMLGVWPVWTCIEFFVSKTVQHLHGEAPQTKETGLKDYDFDRTAFYSRTTTKRDVHRKTRNGYFLC